MLMRFIRRRDHEQNLNKVLRIFMKLEKNVEKRFILEEKTQ